MKWIKSVPFFQLESLLDSNNFRLQEKGRPGVDLIGTTAIGKTPFSKTTFGKKTFGKKTENNLW
jgi:hypothetical protein